MNNSQRKKYENRPSPGFSATDAPGEVHRGNDGNMYISKPTAAGVYRWVKTSGGPKRTRKIARRSKRSSKRSRRSSKRSRRSSKRSRRSRRSKRTARRSRRSSKRSRRFSKRSRKSIIPAFSPIKAFIRHQRRASSRHQRRASSRHQSRASTKKEIYDIHDNGGTPFKVEVEPKKVIVLGNENWGNYDDNYDDEDSYKMKILTIKNPYQVFIGKSKKNKMTEYSGGYGPDYDGNTILIRPTKSLDYIHIGRRIAKFKTDSEILYYLSPVGNNDVPYEYAITKDKIYLLSENKIIRTNQIPEELLKASIDGSDDPYTYYYDNIKKNDSEKLKTKVIFDYYSPYN